AAPAASTAEAAPAPAPKPTLADLIPQTMKAQGEAFNGHDAAKFAANYTTDAVTIDYGMGESHGRDEIQKMIQGFMDMSSDAKGAPAHVWVKGNTAIVDLVSGGTMTGDFMGMKASKKPFGHHMLMVMTFSDDGLISSEHIYGDGPGLMAQLKGAKDAPEVPAMPSGPPEMHFAKNSPDEDKLVDFMKGFNDTFNKDDVKALSAAIAPDAEVTFHFMGGKTLKGGKEIDKFHGDLFKAVPKVQFTTANVWGIDGFAIAERSWSGKMTGKLGPVPATNKDVTVHVADVLVPTADGKVSKGWVFGNMGELMPMPKAKEGAKDAGKEKDKGADKGAAAPKKEEKKDEKKDDKK
ncbi:MAG: nuclear transport factor 2 family protein, partial [Polyangiaceae bacterium]